MHKMTNTENETKHIQKLIGNTLRLGVWVSFCLSILGVLLSFLKIPNSPETQQIFTENPAKFSFTELLSGLICLDASHIAMCGVIVMLLTPLLRVIFLLFAYQKQKNSMYEVISYIVLVIILLSVVIGVVK